eukprot:403341014
MLQVHKQKKSDYVVENLIQINETLRVISTDVAGFKSIRHKLFLKASSDKDPSNRLYLYLFHLFESLVSNINTLIQKSTQSIVSQCPSEMLNQLRDLQNKVNNNDSSMVSNSTNPNEGFFAENFRQLFKSQKEIENIVEQLNKDSGIKQKKLNQQRQALDIFLKELGQQQQNLSVDNSFEVRWSLQELENIVYEFLHFNCMPREFNLKDAPLEAKKEDILKVAKQRDIDGESNTSQQLPDMIRDYILHDRGNSLYLGDSFANLPSPVNESSTMKQLFKGKGDQDDEIKAKKKDKGSKDKDNLEIKIEGKELDETSEQKSMVNINVKDIERIVFVNNKQEAQKAKEAYKEEDSYLNPSNASYHTDEDYDQRIESFNQTAIHNPSNKEQLNQSNLSSSVNRDTIRLNPNDIFIANQSHVNNYINDQSSIRQSDDSRIYNPAKKVKAMDYNPYIPINHNFIQRNLSINILDEQSSMISYSESSKSKNKKAHLTSVDSEPTNQKSIIQQISSSKNHYMNQPAKEQSSYTQSDCLSSGVIRQNLQKRFGAEQSHLNQMQNSNNLNQNQMIHQMLSSSLKDEFEADQSSQSILDISNEDMHSSCKDTVKITQQQDFSFFKDGLRRGFSQMNQDYPTSQDYSQVPNLNQQFNVNQQDTITRLQGLNNSQMSSYQNGVNKIIAKSNPFNVMASQNSQYEEESAYSNQRSIEIQIKSTKFKNKFTKRSISPMVNPNERSQNSSKTRIQNLNKCVSLKQIGQQAATKFPYQAQNFQPMTNKNSVSNYDVSTMDGGAQGQTPSMMSHHNAISQYNSVILSKDPSKRSISSGLQKFKNSNQSSNQKQSYFRGNEVNKSVHDSSSNQPSYRNLDALKIVLNQNDPTRNYISLPVNQSLQNDPISKLSYRGIPQEQLRDQYTKKNHLNPITERGNGYSSRESDLKNGSSSNQSTLHNVKKKVAQVTSQQNAVTGQKRSGSKQAVKKRDMSNLRSGRVGAPEHSNAHNISVLPDIARSIDQKL